jgi:hypothetical protein
MPLSFLPPLLATFFLALASWLDRRTAARLPAILAGALFAKGRRTVTSWFRAAGISTEFRQAYTAINSVGHARTGMAWSTFAALRPLLGSKRLLIAIDDTPTPRYGPEVEGAGIHRHPSAGPVRERFLYGHLFVTACAIVRHPRDGAIALPLMADMYIRNKDIPSLPGERERPFQTKLALAAKQLGWLGRWSEGRFEERWAVVDGAYATTEVLKAGKDAGFVLVSRLRKDAALFSLPVPRKPGQRGRQRKYGADRLSLAKRAAHQQGWQQLECVQYGEKVTKTVKSFQATWKPARGPIRVVIVKEPDEWLAFFCTRPEATAAEILEAAADRNAIEQGFKAVKEVWGAGQQQVRNVDSSEACFNLNLWLMSLVEAWAWERDEEELLDRQDSPWDKEPRRPSHADKRKALQREVLRREINEGLQGRPTKAEIRELLQRLLGLAP